MKARIQRAEGTEASKDSEVRIFNTSLLFRLLAFLAAAGFSAGTVLFHSAEGWSWTTIVFAGLAAIGVAGFMDMLTMRIELHPEHIVVVGNLQKTTYPRSAFSNVTWGKGVPVCLQLTSGGWVKLPGVGPSSQGLVNTLRAWIKR